MRQRRKKFFVNALHHITVAITTMLTLIAYQFAIGTDLPKVPYLTRMDYFILLSTILIYANLIEVIITSTFAENEKLSQARATDCRMRLLFPLAFCILAFISFIV